jgi:hypothetical protein
VKDWDDERNAALAFAFAHPEVVARYFERRRSMIALRAEMDAELEAAGASDDNWFVHWSDPLDPSYSAPVVLEELVSQ